MKTENITSNILDIIYTYIELMFECYSMTKHCKDFRVVQLCSFLHIFSQFIHIVIHRFSSLYCIWDIVVTNVLHFFHL